MPEDEPEMRLVMPFVVTRSAGGKFDDESFVCGYETGHLAAELATCKAMPQGVAAIPGPRFVHTDIVPQLDLTAMNHGYVLTASPADNDPAWSWVQFSIGGDE